MDNTKLELGGIEELEDFLKSRKECDCNMHQATAFFIAEILRTIRHSTPNVLKMLGKAKALDLEKIECSMFLVQVIREIEEQYHTIMHKDIVSHIAPSTTTAQ